MKYLKRLAAASGLFAFLYIPSPETADAYIDPGTGSIIIQVLIGFAVGGLFAVKVFWTRIKTFFKNMLTRGGSVEETED